MLDAAIGRRRVRIDPTGECVAAAPPAGGRLSLGSNHGDVHAAGVAVWGGRDLRNVRVILQPDPALLTDDPAEVGPGHTTVLDVWATGNGTFTAGFTGEFFTSNNRAILTTLTFDRSGYEIEERTRGRVEHRKHLSGPHFDGNLFGTRAVREAAADFGVHDIGWTDEQLVFAQAAVAGETLAIGTWYRTPDW